MLTRFFNRNYKLLSIIILLLFGFIVYSNTFFNSFHFDDGSGIVNNFAIRDIWNLRNIWNAWPARFITILTFALNYHFSKVNVFSYHVFNTAIHLASAILVFWLTILILSTPTMKKNAISKYADSIALFVGLIFVTHPVQTQSVTYIWQRSSSLVGFFYLFSLCFYIKTRLLQIDNKATSKWPFFYAFSYVFCILSMFTKENAATLPLIVLLCEFCFFNIERYANWKYALYFLITILIIPLLLFSTRSENFMCIQRLIDKPLNKGGAYFLTQFRVILTYIRLLFAPLNQNLDYDYPIAKNLMDINTLGSLFILAAIIMGAIRIFPRYRLLSFGIFWFFITLLPESSIVPLDDVIFEHRLYLPIVGYSLFIVSGMYYLFGKNALKQVVIILLMIVTSYSILTYYRNFVWKDELTLWNDVTCKSPHKARPYNNRGNAYKKKGNLDQAFLDYSKAIEVDPNYALAYYNRGLLYQDRGNLDQALLDYNKGIEIDPNYALAYYNRGLLYQDRGNLDQALLDYNKGIEIDPNYALAYYNRGNTYRSKGNINQAFLDYNKTIEIDPNCDLAYLNRGLLYRKQGNINQALLDYNKVIEIDPNHALAYNNRGIAYYIKKEYDKSLRDILQAKALGCKINPKLLEELKKILGVK